MNYAILKVQNPPPKVIDENQISEKLTGLSF